MIDRYMEWVFEREGFESFICIFGTILIIMSLILFLIFLAVASRGIILLIPIVYTLYKYNTRPNK